MAHFYFDLHECGHGAVIDDEGADLPGVAAARERAIATAREIMASEVATGKLCLGCAIVVRDALGVNVLAVPFTDALTITSAASC